MSDWDSDNGGATKLTAAALPTLSKKWADEDAEEDSEKDRRKNEQESKPKGPIRNKGITKMKIAEKEAEEASRLAELRALEEQESDPTLRKRRDQQRAVEADLENARGLFGDAAISKNSEDPFKMDPITKADFESLSLALSDLIVSKHGKKPLFPMFVESFVKQIAGPLTDVQTRKAASVLTTLANEKQRLIKDSTKKGGKAKSKPTKGGRGINADLEIYDQALDDDFDDFVSF
ncbi:eukaryotic translation initiation factor 3 subunit J [Phakopsora pachyrhizi]|uniref:Eukaryotic translation initiation factor 3 30 kDa subunit n=1 Tax=Phakopsora pachyrhizi TaxID=170000 RepID=A0AAV0AR38_PHAPC|nr:eukaryotic translation initiation factor 3 subunit J [Phakopsora pachyrhizi]